MEIKLGKKRLSLEVKTSARLRRNPDANEGTRSRRFLQTTSHKFAAFLVAVAKEVLRPTEIDEDSS